MRDVVAGLVALVLLLVAASLATTLQALPTAPAARARFRARARPARSSPNSRRRTIWCSFSEDDVRISTTASASIDKDLIVAVRVLINGAPIAAYVSQRATPRRRQRQATSFEDRPEGIARDRWDVAIETVDRDDVGRVRRDP